jgi:transcriptional regulator with XRE-family HTH domain
MYKLSDRFLAALARTGLHRYQIAGKLGTPPAWLSEITRGYKRNLSELDRERLRALAAMLGLRAEDIFAD